jgi:hypothetical protein
MAPTGFRGLSQLPSPHLPEPSRHAENNGTPQRSGTRIGLPRIDASVPNRQQQNLESARLPVLGEIGRVNPIAFMHPELFAALAVARWRSGSPARRYSPILAATRQCPTDLSPLSALALRGNALPPSSIVWTASWRTLLRKARNYAWGCRKHRLPFTMLWDDSAATIRRWNTLGCPVTSNAFVAVPLAGSRCAVGVFRVRCLGKRCSVGCGATYP